MKDRVKYDKIRKLIRESLNELFLSEDDGPKIRASVDWMRENYEKANKELFGGQLGECNFEYGPIGERVLGNFSMRSNGRKLAADRYSRRMYVKDWWGDKEFINKGNFFELCEPTILLNSNYTGSYSALYNTLVHEMCHYYTYMHGYAPKQAHGREFREIGSIVAYRSNGEITIQRLATAEDMSNYELNQTLQQRQDKRKANKKLNAHYYIVLCSDGETRLINTKSTEVVNDVIRTANRRGQKVLNITSQEITEELFDTGKTSISRTYRYWPVDRRSQLISKILDNPENYEVIYEP